jgi:hypothetical protein
VERALKITIEEKYDFDTHKVIPQPDPSHPARKPTTSMFAFSEMIWLPKIEFHLEKSLPRLKEKEKGYGGSCSIYECYALKG